MLNGEMGREMKGVFGGELGEQSGLSLFYFIERQWENKWFLVVYYLLFKY